MSSPVQGFSGSLVKAASEVPPEKPDPQLEYASKVAGNQLSIMKLLPIVQVSLTPTEVEKVQTFQMASLVLGAAAVAPMVCSARCPDPIKNACPLVQINRQPVGERCPFEQQYVQERFLGWMQELGRTLEDLLESERAAIATLSVLDLQERRCTAILAWAENARLVSRSVRDIDLETGRPLAWEDVIHVNAQRMNEISIQRRGLLKDLELTPEAKTRRLKALSSLKGGATQIGGFASRQSDKADKIRLAQQGQIKEIIDVS